MMPLSTESTTARATAACAGPNIWTACLAPLIVTLLNSNVSGFAGKFGAIGLAARWQGMGWSEAGSMGALANARGLMELILLNIGQTAGLITPQLYTVLALMTIITTFAATPIR